MYFFFLASYSYTNDRNFYLEKLAYGNGDSVQYEYDDQGRVTKQTYEDNSYVTYDYDNSGALATVYDSETGISTTYYYDLIDRMMKYVESGNGYSHSVGYEYDTINNLTQMVETINGVKRTTSYGYDDDNRVISITNDLTPDVANDGITESYTYDAFGRIATKITKNGEATVLTETYTYKPGPNGTLTSQIATYKTEGANYSVTYTYDYDTNGNITSVSDGTYTTSYAYDSANQLVREDNEQAGKSWTWSYDNAGNIQAESVFPYTVGELDSSDYDYEYDYDNSQWRDLLTAYDGTAITYDQIGNPLSDGTWSYTWKQGRQLATLSDGASTWMNTYNADGLRTSRSNGTSSYSYVYNGSQLVQMTVDGNTLLFTYDASGTPQTVTYNGTTYFYATNLQGDITAILNASGETVVSYSYDAWGNHTSGNNGTGTLASTLGKHNPLRYRGYVYDVETGLYYLQSRYYNPAIGRFLNADAYAATGQGILGNNMFAYCLNNPINFVDTNGTDAVWIQEKERADGNGHSGLLVQDEDGNWYFFYWGSSGTTSTLQKVLGTDYDYVFVRIDCPEGADFHSIEDIIEALSNSDNEMAKIRASYITGSYYLEGDYTETYTYLNSAAEQIEAGKHPLGRYQLLWNNCAQVTWRALGCSNQRLAENLCPIIPNEAYLRMQSIVSLNDFAYFYWMKSMHNLSIY